MADVADYANDLVQDRIDRALAERSALKVSTIGHSLLFCETCDDPIPEARRLAQAGCTQCVSCLSQLESREARYAR
jgi:phage/conjugal plasmid C-4 type zinc finger TraR family protein